MTPLYPTAYYPPVILTILPPEPLLPDPCGPVLDWIHRVAAKKTTKDIFLELIKIPEADISPRYMFNITCADELRDAFLGFNVKELRLVFDWIFDEIEDLEIPASVTPEEAKRIKLKLNPLRFLLGVLCESLDQKGLLEDFQDETSYTRLWNRFNTLQDRALIRV